MALTDRGLPLFIIQAPINTKVCNVYTHAAAELLSFTSTSGEEQLVVR